MKKHIIFFYNKCKNFLNKNIQRWKAIIFIIILSLISTYLWEYHIKPAYENIRYYYSDKPQIVISVHRNILTNPDEVPNISRISNLTNNIQIFFETCCNVRYTLQSIKVFDSNPNIQMTYKSGTTEECKFSNSENCYFYTFDIHNDGKGKAESIVVHGSLMTDKIEFQQYSPEIKLQEGTGFFGMKNFYFEIYDLKEMEHLELLLKASSIADMKLDCEVNERKDLCSYKLYNYYSTEIKNPVGIIMEGKTIPFPPTSYDPKFYNLNENYFWEEVNPELLKISCKCK